MTVESDKTTVLTVLASHERGCSRGFHQPTIERCFGTCILATIALRALDQRDEAVKLASDYDEMLTHWDDVDETTAHLVGPHIQSLFDRLASLKANPQ